MQSIGKYAISHQINRKENEMETANVVKDVRISVEQWHRFLNYAIFVGRVEGLIKSLDYGWCKEKEIVERLREEIKPFKT